MKCQKDFKNWEDNFRKSTKGKEALSKLKDLDIHDDELRFKKLEKLVLENCYLAQSYRQDKDWAVKIRDRHKLIDKPAINSQINSIKKIRQFIKRHPDVSSTAMTYALFDLKKKNISVSTIDKSKISCDKLIDEILLEYSRGLSQPIPGFKSGPFAHRFSFGTLIYPKPLDEQSQRPKDITLNHYCPVV